MTPEAPYDPELLRLSLRSRSVSYTDDGSRGPAYVLVHGLPGSVRDFRWLGAALRERAPEARVVRVDMPGFGGTDVALGGRMTVEARAGFVAELFAELELDDVVLVGHSMGGAVALGAAALASDQVRGLAVMSSVGLTPHRGYRAMPYPPLLSRIVNSAPGRWVLGGRLRREFMRVGFPSSTTTEAMLITMRALGALRFPAIRAFAKQVGASGVPVRVFLAEDDPLVERAIAGELARALGGRLRLFEAGGHNIQKSQAVEIAEDLVAMAGYDSIVD